MNLTALIALTVSALEALAPARAVLTTPAALSLSAIAAVHEADSETADLAVGQWRTIVSPWGWCDTYFVFHGYNTLICSGTGRCFTYYHCGFAVEGEGELTLDAHVMR